MASRVTSELLLVGSLPVDSTETAFRAGAELFGDMVFALPDGETGPRAAWVGYERETLARPNPEVIVVSETESPTGRPRHAYETPVFGIREGVTELHFDRWPRIDDAIESYRVFRALRDEGVIPTGLRFQVGLPFPASALNAFKADFASDYPKAERGFEKLVARELERMLAEIPAEDLAIQWDCAYETQDIEGVLAWTTEGGWERFAGPRYLRSEDRNFFRPLVDLEPGPARVFLGIVLPIDGVSGLERRHRTASRYLSDFGVAMYCGFGRQPGADGMETMREHRRVARSIKHGA